jgi:histidinol-phosphate aminotransferase
MSTIQYRKTLESISPYIPGKPIDDVKREMGLESVIKLASNENPLGCSPKAKQAILSALENPALYPDGNCTELRNELSEIFNLPCDRFIFGAGSNELVAFIAETFINPGDESIMAVPTFPWYDTGVRMMDGVVVEVPLKNHKHDLETMRAKITDRTKVIWLCNPNNPPGTMYSREEQDSFLKSVPKNIVVVLDEAYYEYVTNTAEYPESVNLLDEYFNIIILRTFSKVYGLASLRIGYGIASAEMISYLNRVRPPFNVNTIAQAAALASIRDEDFRLKSRECNIKGKEYYYGIFAEMHLEYIPTECNFIMVNTGMESMEMFNRLLRKGIIVRPGKGFGMPTWQRVTIGTQQENEAFVTALKEILSER